MFFDEQKLEEGDLIEMQSIKDAVLGTTWQFNQYFRPSSERTVPGSLVAVSYRKQHSDIGIYQYINGKPKPLGSMRIGATQKSIMTPKVSLFISLSSHPESSVLSPSVFGVMTQIKYDGTLENQVGYDKDSHQFQIAAPGGNTEL